MTQPPSASLPMHATLLRAVVIHFIWQAAALGFMSLV